MTDTAQTAAPLTLPGVPEAITRQAVLELLAALGLPAEDLRSFRIHPGAIEAEVYARHPEHGRRYTADDLTVAIHTVCIPIVDGVE